jgi:hypothetical protein
MCIAGCSLWCGPRYDMHFACWFRWDDYFLTKEERWETKQIKYIFWTTIEIRTCFQCCVLCWYFIVFMFMFIAILYVFTILYKINQFKIILKCASFYYQQHFIIWLWTQHTSSTNTESVYIMYLMCNDNYVPSSWIITGCIYMCISLPSFWFIYEDNWLNPSFGQTMYAIWQWLIQNLSSMLNALLYANQICFETFQIECSY